MNIFNKETSSIKSILTFLFQLLFKPWKDYYFKYFRAFGVPISLRSPNKLRLSRGFETKQDAIKCSTTEKSNIDAVSWFIVSLYTIPRTTIVLFQSDKEKYERFLILKMIEIQH